MPYVSGGQIAENEFAFNAHTTPRRDWGLPAIRQLNEVTAEAQRFLDEDLAAGWGKVQQRYAR